MTRIFSIFLILTSVFSNIGFSQNRFEIINNKTDILVSKFLIKENIPGASITISINDTVIFSKGYGYSDIEKKAIVKANKTKFKIASIAKTITASSVLKLEELGKIDITKSVYFYLDSLDKKKFDFNILQVGGHLAGLKRHPSTEQYVCENPYKNKDFYKIFKTDSLIAKPSTKFLYSNYGYKILGLIIEKIESDSIENIHKKYIIDKLKLKNTMPDKGVYDEDTSTFYSTSNGKVIVTPCMDCSFMYAEGCYLSTSEDLNILGNAYLFPNRILKKESLIKLIKSQKLSTGKKTGYGFGFFSDNDLFGNYFYGHNGNLPGGRSLLRIYPNSKLVISILMNKSDEDIDSITTKIANNYIKELK